jgi:polysaccharide export outer membrane protein
LKQQLILFLIFTLLASKTFAETEFPLTPTEIPSIESEISPIPPAKTSPATEAKADVVILKDPDELAGYLLAPGDALEITVWKEEGLQQQQFLIGPDGHIVYPLIGTITAAGRTIHDLKELLSVKLADYIADPSVSVKLLNNQGNAVFVIGKVNKPGQVFSGRRIDVLQALSLAGGLTVFASEGNINIQRRVGNEIKVFPFDYSNVIDGDDLQQNILLEPGDTITVP